MAVEMSNAALDIYFDALSACTKVAVCDTASPTYAGASVLASSGGNALAYLTLDEDSFGSPLTSGDYRQMTMSAPECLVSEEGTALSFVLLDEVNEEVMSTSSIDSIELHDGYKISFPTITFRLRRRST